MVAAINKPFSQNPIIEYFIQDWKQLGAAWHEKEMSVLPNPTGYRNGPLGSATEASNLFVYFLPF